MKRTEPTVNLDATLAGAGEAARAVVVEDAGADAVGEHLGVVAESEGLALHTFACLLPGYPGWQWAVSLALVGEGEPTVCDVVLLPGPDAIVAPAWVPWSERVQPGDLGVGDVLPTSATDLRLVPGYTGEDNPADVEDGDNPLPTGWEIGLGRVRVLSPLGRDEAADRWHSGELGPDAAMARNASQECVSCGFMVPLSGGFGQAFGVCANRMSPADARVVALDFGCGAHSQVVVEQVVEPVDLTTPEETASELGHS